MRPYRQLAPVALHSEPCLRFNTVNIYLGIREHYYPFLQQTAYVVGSLIIFGWLRLPLSRLGIIHASMASALAAPSVGLCILSFIHVHTILFVSI